MCTVLDTATVLHETVKVWYQNFKNKDCNIQEEVCFNQLIDIYDKHLLISVSSGLNCTKIYKQNLYYNQ